MRPNQFITSAAIFIVSLITPALQAQNITGSIGFGSLGATVNNGTFADATTFTLNSPFITTETGVYTGVPLATPVTYTSFQFNPPAAAVTPLWSFNVGPITYTFNATSVSSSYNTPLQEWNIGGNGVAMVTGYTATPGVWNMNLSKSGTTIVFDSSEGVTAVPEPSSLMLAGGGGLIALAGVARKLKV